MWLMLLMLACGPNAEEIREEMAASKAAKEKGRQEAQLEGEAKERRRWMEQAPTKVPKWDDNIEVRKPAAVLYTMAQLGNMDGRERTFDVWDRTAKPWVEYHIESIPTYVSHHATTAGTGHVLMSHAKNGEMPPVDVVVDYPIRWDDDEEAFVSMGSPEVQNVAGKDLYQYERKGDFWTRTD